MSSLVDVLGKRSTMGSAVGIAAFAAALYAAQDYIEIRSHSGLVIAAFAALAALPGLDVIIKNWAAGGNAPPRQRQGT